MIKKSQKSLRLVIHECRACYSKKFIPILSLGNQYLSDFVKKKNEVQKFPLDLVMCSSCSLVQLRHTTPPKLLYTERYGYRSGINTTMQKELRNIVEQAIKHSRIKKGDAVIDIGSNDGTLLRIYSKNLIRIGFEPVKKFAKISQKNASHIINDYFSYNSFLKNAVRLRNVKAKVITSVAMFYDIHNPNRFLEDVAKILRDDGVFIIQQNYVGGMIEQNAFDNILHEHLEYYSLFSLEKLLARHNMYIFDVEESNINGGSFRTYIKFKRGKNNPESARVKKLRMKEEKLGLRKKITYLKFAKKVKSISRKIHEFIKKESSKGKVIYVYGASTRGNTLLQYCKLDSSLIKAAVERNQEKWGKYIASVGIPIISEEQARRDKPDYMLVLPWFFQEEFLNREKRYLDSGGHFIFPLPDIKVV